jgi:hypothetical protein
LQREEVGQWSEGIVAASMTGMLTVLTLLLASALAADAPIDTINGWGKRTWGSFPSADLVAVGREDGIVFYALPEGDTPRLDKLDVSELVLGYQEDQLVAFRFEVERKLGKAMKNHFGKATRTGIGEAYWIGERVKLTVTGSVATFTFTEELGTGASLSTSMSRAVDGGATEKGSLDFLDTRPGWRDLAWASLPADGMERVDGEDGDEAYYIRDTDKLSAGQYPLTNIGYGYFKSQLFSVMLMIPDSDSLRGIRAGLVDAYGPPTNENGRNAAWRGQRVDLTLTFDTETNQGAVIYFYVPVRDQLDAAEAAAAETAAEDL